MKFSGFEPDPLEHTLKAAYQGVVSIAEQHIFNIEAQANALLKESLIRMLHKTRLGAIKTNYGADNTSIDGG